MEQRERLELENHSVCNLIFCFLSMISKEPKTSTFTIFRWILLFLSHRTTYSSLRSNFITSFSENDVAQEFWNSKFVSVLKCICVDMLNKFYDEMLVYTQLCWAVTVLFEKRESIEESKQKQPIEMRPQFKDISWKCISAQNVASNVLIRVATDTYEWVHFSYLYAWHDHNGPDLFLECRFVHQ